MNVRCYLAVLFALCCSPAALFAQDYLYATGSPVYATTIPIDHGIINVNNGDIHLEFPIATKQQRGALALDEKLIYDSRIWKLVQNGSSISWAPTNAIGSGGWSFSSGAGSGTITYVLSGGTNPNLPNCDPEQPNYPAQYIAYQNWKWTDPAGTVHGFPTVATIQYEEENSICTPSSGVSSSSGFASDGSGYTLSVSNFSTPVITDVHGTSYYPASSANQGATDRNGNYWSKDSNGNLVDTSGVAPVLATTSGNTTTYSVLGVNGQRNNYVVTMESVSFDTAFGEEAASEDSGSFQAVQSIVLPDGSRYSFTYDSGTSPGHYGELTSMTLPTGGVVTYGFSNYLDSYKNQNRWLTSLTKDGGTTTFSPAVISLCSSSEGCQENMTVQAPDSNQTVYIFNLDKAGAYDGESWVSSIKSYKGSASGGQSLRTTTSSYTYSTGNAVIYENGQTYTGASYEIPASITNTLTLNDVGLTTQTATTFNYGGSLPTEIKAWNFSTSPSGAPDTDTVYQYESYNFPTSITVKDGSGHQIASTTYGYDETTAASTSGVPNHTSTNTGNYRGNQTSEHDWVSTSGTTLNTTMTYDDTGALLSKTAPDGTTSYGYDSTHTFVTSVTDPAVPSGVTLTTQTAYDASTGAVTQTTDENGHTTTYSGFDVFNRPTSIAYPDGGSTTIIYRNPNQTGVFHSQSSSQTTETETLLDGYGRQSRVAEAENASSNVWYQTDTCYDTSGRVEFSSYQYQGSGFGPAKVCSGGGDTTVYDALSRPLTITHVNNTQVTYQYTGRATKVTDESGVSRITQTDAFGRPTTVCELSSSTLEGDVPANCGTDIAGTGFVTSYVYTLASHLTTVTQGAQTRTFQTDSLGRTIAVTEPERGGTTYGYSYNGTGLLVTRARPQANQTGSATTTTTTQYDALGRIATITYSDSLTPPKYFTYDVSAGWERGGQTNVKGRLSKAQANVLGNYEAAIYSYDAMGRPIFAGQCFAYGCGNGAKDKYSFAAYDFAGNLTGVQDATNLSINYTYSPDNELTGATSSNTGTGDPTTLLSNVQNGADGPNSYSLGNGLGEYFTYDALERNTGKWLCSTTPGYHCPNGGQVYGTELAWVGSKVTADCDTVIGNCRNYSYDEFGRLKATTLNYTTTNSNSNSSFTYTYDRYGNRWNQTVTGGSGPQPQFQFNKGNNQVVGYSYDAAGNVTSDGVHTYTYDAEGNVLQVDGGKTATYTYDALNRRFRIANTSETVDYEFDVLGRRAVEWAESADFGIRGNVYWGGTGTPLAYHGINGTEYFEQQDWTGTERVRTDYTGKVVGSYFSYAFGDGFAVTGNDEDPYHFAGLDHDSESSTDHAQFRQYSETAGRWMSPDPYDGSYVWSDPQSLNRYSYVAGNPLGFEDPSGLCWLCFVWSGYNSDGSLVTNVLDFSPFVTYAGVALGVGLGVDELGKLLGLWGGPQFHGTLQPRPSAPNSQMKTCKADAHGVQNNLPTRAPTRAGSYGVPETPGTAAIDRSQWLPSGSSSWTSIQANAYINQYRTQISGYVPNGSGGYIQVFNGVSDNMGPASGVAALIQRYPNRVLFELPGGQDLGNVNGMQFQVPSAMTCPNP